MVTPIVPSYFLKIKLPVTPIGTYNISLEAVDFI
jgi:hypothetical protein